MWETRRLKLWLQIMVSLMSISMQMEDVTARSIGGTTKTVGKDSALELTMETFNSTLWAAPVTWAIVEFYAHWCPACQKFKPQYELVAQLFNGPDAAYPGVLLFAKVDCAEERNRNLCYRFSVRQYPTMLWGKPAALAWGSRLEADNNFEQISARSNAKSLLDWINTRLGRSYSLDATNEKQQLAQVTGFSGQAASMHDLEEATAEAYGIILDNKLVSSRHRTPFVQFFQLLSVHHPSKRCRSGSAEILINLVDMWPAEHALEVDEHTTDGESQTSSGVADVNGLRQLHVCGADVPHGNYKSCKMATGGFSCGLWYLFHALSVRVDNLESRSALKTIHDFVENFFPCQECREHFLKMSESAIDVVSSRRALTLWLWRAHNEVNSRLANEASKLQLQLSSQKVQWPPVQICASCRIISQKIHGNTEAEVEWEEDKVYQFLRSTYGQSLDTATEEAKTVGSRQLDGVINEREESMTGAIAVPVGAALGIAIASCGFGLVACCWRLQQKKRKHMRRRI